MDVNEASHRCCHGQQQQQQPQQQQQQAVEAAESDPSAAVDSAADNFDIGGLVGKRPLVFDKVTNKSGPSFSEAIACQKQIFPLFILEENTNKKEKGVIVIREHVRFDSL